MFKNVVILFTADLEDKLKAKKIDKRHLKQLERNVCRRKRKKTVCHTI